MMKNNRIVTVGMPELSARIGTRLGGVERLEVR
jgi:hypothetical protein